MGTIGIEVVFPCIAASSARSSDWRDTQGRMDVSSSVSGSTLTGRATYSALEMVMT